MNDPDPSVGLTPLPNNIHAMLLEIDDTECINSGPVDWAPHAQSPATALKMFTRVMRDGRLLPILTAVCVALLAEMYTTTSAGGSASVRQRLQYSTSPIADFGIVLGKVTVPQCERLAYKRASNGVVVLGQDPEQHWWLYFTTIRGEDFFLDVGLFPFNFSMVVETAPYRPSGLKGSVFNSFPVYCVNRQIRKYLSSIHLEHKRVSALRDTRLHRAVSSMTHEGGTDYAPILEFMEDIAGSKMVENEREEVEQVLVGLRPTLKDILQREAWKDYPERPEVLAHIDPEEEEAYIRQGPNLDTRTVPLDSCWFSS
ncbi:hypothetical protein PsYK624_079710 [Phanerochaete sordida]|uniref:Uncharacterized protein n=1 Tax=Phanerochaete sordida TaxID=48140 RepID=A0A9P3GBW2_9APHY|nr:hypothetical protein PsYK624_079710 [Phanerochaete sordida]